MRRIQSGMTFVLMLLLSLGVQAEDAASIMEKAREKQLARWEGVQSYTVEQDVAGTPIVMTYERVDETSFRIVPQFGSMTMPADDQDDGNVVNFDEMQDLAKSARLVGTETINGRKAFHLDADSVEHVQQMDDEQVSFERFEIWLDTSEYVPLKMRIEGTSSSPQGSRPVVIENVHSDYRSVPGSNMYEAYSQVMTMNGVLDEAEQEQLQEAAAQMAEFEKEMAAMPPAQREMMERMMGPKLEMMKKMAAGGGMEIVTEVKSIKVNTGAEQ